MREGNGRIARRLRVLIADDNRDGAETLAMLLRMSGHETRTAHDGSLALQIASSGWADIAFLDLEMPCLSGYDVARAVRASVSAREMKLVALTGWTRERDRTSARAAGFDQFLIKPADLADLDALFRKFEPSWIRAGEHLL